MTLRIFIATALLFIVSGWLPAASPAENLLRKPDEWFRSDAGQETLENVLSWQTDHGDWPKNKDTTSELFSGNGNKPAGTFDNSATTGELRLLARAYRVTENQRYKQACLRGFDHILAAQYPNGGWPQYYPLSNGYHRHITFNDGTMIRVMEFLRDAGSSEDFDFLDKDRRSAALEAVDRGIDCIIKCQVIVNGVPTVWCAQHHAESLVPVLARSYEHPSLSGAESAGILMYLMSLESPSPEVVSSVKAGVAWFESAKIEGYRYKKSKTEPALTEDLSASPLWARFYDIDSNRPIFSDRDGVIMYEISEIGSERRGGYTWYGGWGANVLHAYAKWPHR